MHSTIIGNLNEVSSNKWNALHGTQVPFLRHEFLSALEKYHCVGKATGWIPQHILLYEDKTLLGAVPQYLKTNPYGELVFDWAWAEAYQRNGLDYYPKLVVAIPYTPASGPRLLIAPHADRDNVSAQLIQCALEHARQKKVSSLHCLFPHQDDLQQLTQQGLLPRLGYQFHWHNLPDTENYRDFDDYLDRFTSSKRKKIRRERRAVTEAGIILQRLYGNELSDEQWQAVHRHYCSTFDRLSGYATLSLDFFREISRTLPQQLIVILAEHQGNAVASAVATGAAIPIFKTCILRLVITKDWNTALSITCNALTPEPRANIKSVAVFCPLPLGQPTGSPTPGFVQPSQIFYRKKPRVFSITSTTCTNTRPSNDSATEQQQATLCLTILSHINVSSTNN